MIADASMPTLATPSQQRLRLRAGRISVAIGLIMFATKSCAYLLTGSTAIFSDAIESVVHVIATGIALYSLVLAGRPADKRHPYGYGKVEYFSAGMEGVLILLAAIAICYQAMCDILLSSSSLRQLDIGVLALACAGVVNLMLGLYLVRVGKQTNSLVLVADGEHVLTDSYTSIGVLVGIVLVRLTGITLLDPLVAIMVAANITGTGYRLVRQSVRGLMNAADQETLQRTIEAIRRARTPDMVDLHRLRAWRAGEQRFIDFHLTLPHYMPLQGAGDLRDHLCQAIKREFGDRADVMIHLDLCNRSHCVSCGKSDCSVRATPRILEHQPAVQGRLDNGEMAADEEGAA